MITLHCDAPNCLSRAPCNGVKFGMFEHPAEWCVSIGDGRCVIACSSAHLNDALKHKPVDVEKNEYQGKFW